MCCFKQLKISLMRFLKYSTANIFQTSFETLNKKLQFLLRLCSILKLIFVHISGLLQLRSLHSNGVMPFLTSNNYEFHLFPNCILEGVDDFVPLVPDVFFWNKPTGINQPRLGPVIGKGTE